MIEGAGDREAAAVVRRAGLDVLPLLEPLLTATRAIDALERVESVWKLALLGLFERDVPGSVARDVARFQQRVGFLLKYKSYAIKAASPIGYSLFVPDPR